MVARDWSLRPPLIKVLSLYKSICTELAESSNPRDYLQQVHIQLRPALLPRLPIEKDLLSYKSSLYKSGRGAQPLKSPHSIAARDWALRLPIKGFAISYLPLAIGTRPGWHILTIKQKVKSKHVSTLTMLCYYFSNRYAKVLACLQTCSQSSCFGLVEMVRTRSRTSYCQIWYDWCHYWHQQNGWPSNHLQPHHHSQCFCIWIFRHHRQHQW